MYCISLNFTMQYCTVLNCTVLYCMVLYRTVLYCTILYFNVLHYEHWQSLKNKQSVCYDFDLATGQAKLISLIMILYCSQPTSINLYTVLVYAFHEAVYKKTIFCQSWQLLIKFQCFSSVFPCWKAYMHCKAQHTTLHEPIFFPINGNFAFSLQLNSSNFCFVDGNANIEIYSFEAKYPSRLQTQKE